MVQPKTRRIASEAYADSAVDANPKIATIEQTAVFDGDGRLLEVVTIDGIMFAVVDGQDRRSWLEFGPDLKPTPYAAGLVGESLGIEDVALDSGEMFAVVDESDRVLFSDLGKNDPEPESGPSSLPSDDWAHWGDSMTDDVLTGAEGWTTKLAEYTGRNHYNGGWYNQKAHQIAARQGALPPLVTVAGNATAASGATAITELVNNPAGVSTTRIARGRLAGIAGYIQQPTAGAWTFTPDLPGTYPIPPKSRFISEPGATNLGRTATIWAGRNDIWDAEAPAMVVAAIQAMIDNLGSDVRRVLVMEVPPSAGDGATGKANCATMNDAIKAAFPAYWTPIATWLRTDEAATAAGVTYSADDLDDIANDRTPRSFRSDGIHLNAAGCTAVAYRIHQEAQKRGWL